MVVPLPAGFFDKGKHKVRSYWEMAESDYRF